MIIGTDSDTAPTIVTVTFSLEITETPPITIGPAREASR